MPGKRRRTWRRCCDCGNHSTDFYRADRYGELYRCRDCHEDSVRRRVKLDIHGNGMVGPRMNALDGMAT